MLLLFDSSSNNISIFWRKCCCMQILLIRTSQIIGRSLTSDITERERCSIFFYDHCSENSKEMTGIKPGMLIRNAEELGMWSNNSSSERTRVVYLFKKKNVFTKLKNRNKEWKKLRIVFNAIGRTILLN